MWKVSKKIKRYTNLFKVVENWGEYLWSKSTGFGDYFDFKIRDFGTVRVKSQTLGPFRENFLDEIYLSKLPTSIFKKEELTVIDIGANIGYFSLFFLSKYRNARIYAFEPHPYCFQVLSEYQKEFSNCDINISQEAVGDKNDTLILNTSNLDGFATMSSIFTNVHKKQKQFEVQSTTLDSVVQERGIETIGLLKLDCEGSEYSILYSASHELLAKIRAMSIETHLGAGPKENLLSLVEFVKDAGFKIEYSDEGETGYIWAWK
jgi:FkbM family methyltransferase